MGAAAPVSYDNLELLISRGELSTRKVTEIINQRRRNARKFIWEASADEAHALMEPILSLTEIINQHRRNTQKSLQKKRIDKARTVSGPILSLIERHFHIPADVVVGPSREAPIIMARAIAIWLMREEFGLSYPAIATIFKRNHTSTRHHYLRMVKRASYPDFRRRLEGFQRELKNG